MREGVSAADVARRVPAAVDAFVLLLEGAGAWVAQRPSETRWSILEYGGHLRDVLISLRERAVLAAVEDHPTGTPIHRDDRVDLGLYRLDTVAALSQELPVTSRLLLHTLEAMPAGYADRPLLYSPVTPEEVTIAWLGTQAVHECEHHLDDARTNLERLTTEA